jgi:GT2 family glycosyltransferase
MHTVGIIVVNWNGYELTSDCLCSLGTIKKNGFQTRIYVIDNGSSDGSIERLKKKFSDPVFILNSVNLGFSHANNQGINQALTDGCEYLWILNNDTTVDANAINPVLKLFENPQIGIAGSKIYFFPGKEYHIDRYKPENKGSVIWYAGGIIDWDNMYASHRGVDEIDLGQFDKTEETDYVSGCSMFIKKSVIEKVGLFDNKFFMYMEDLDFCIRANNNGFKIYYIPDSRVWHKNAGSSKGPGSQIHEYYQTRNRLLIGWRYAKFRTKTALFRESIRNLLFGNRVIRQAVKDAMRGRFGPEKYE